MFNKTQLELRSGATVATHLICRFSVNKSERPIMLTAITSPIATHCKRRQLKRDAPHVCERTLTVMAAMNMLVWRRKSDIKLRSIRRNSRSLVAKAVPQLLEVRQELREDGGREGGVVCVLHLVQVVEQLVKDVPCVAVANRRADRHELRRVVSLVLNVTLAPLTRLGIRMSRTSKPT